MASARSLRSLDLLNFFVADVQTGFGPFIAGYLAVHKWTQIEIGFALTLGTMSAMLSQVPAGAFVDAINSKRAAAAFGILCIIGSALLFATIPVHLPVYIAELFHGFASCIIAPAVAAVSLRLVGHVALGERLGRNARFMSVGNGIAAAVMGVVGSYVSGSAVFWLTAALGVPALIALGQIEPAAPEVRTRVRRRIEWRGIYELLTDSRLLIFAVCALLFHLSNAALLPLASAQVTKQAGTSAYLIIAACIVTPQIVVALLSPRLGRMAQEQGRRMVMLLGWASLPIRGLLMAMAPDPYTLVALQVLAGISAGVFGIMLPLVSADLTEGTGRFNLCMGIVGLAVFVGASLSNTLGGFLADRFGDSAAFVGLALAGLCATVMVRFVMPETRTWHASAAPQPVGARA